MQMVNYLTSDDVIRKPFLQSEILPRFTSMVLNVLYNITGPKSLEFKVDNMESYHFQPLEMLKEACQIVLHVAEYPEFQEAVVAGTLRDMSYSFTYSYS